MSRIKIFVSRDWAPIRLITLTRVLALLVVLAVLIMAGALSQAQSNFTVIHNFTGPDGAFPTSAPTLDSHGNLYGTTLGGGTAGWGTVYELAHVSGFWILYPLYSFTDSSDGYSVFDGVTIGPDGTLFGVTHGRSDNYGRLYNLRPPAHLVCAGALCPRNHVALHSFSGGSDGRYPTGNVVFDFQGNLYGTTLWGGTYDAGTVYKATLSGATWNVSAIYNFGASGNDGQNPEAGVVLDGAGNIYGTTGGGGTYNCGTVFKLSPSGGGWAETVLHSFMGGGDGCFLNAGLVFDQAGNLYGATTGYARGSGTIFEPSPQGGGWNFSTIYTFSGNGPASTLAIDAAGNLYGTLTNRSAYDPGTVFKLSPSGGGWTYADLHDFTGGNDGRYPVGGVAIAGPGGYLYGTTERGGANDDGVIYQINLGAR